ncbi:unnamed protein product [Moneuplotes crassus]|uniref:Uncharacterized protein n=1 Tax=Euplotes crassus TaxID=5936 RepID=A0AAD2D5A0_EUPCR|nr:unnamed protein product [Moneuplotes crassus]
MLVRVKSKPKKSIRQVLKGVKEKRTSKSCRRGGKDGKRSDRNAKICLKSPFVGNKGRFSLKKLTLKTLLKNKILSVPNPIFEVNLNPKPIFEIIKVTKYSKLNGKMNNVENREEQKCHDLSSSKSSLHSEPTSDYEIQSDTSEASQMESLLTEIMNDQSCKICSSHSSPQKTPKITPKVLKDDASTSKPKIKKRIRKEMSKDSDKDQSEILIE